MENDIFFYAVIFILPVTMVLLYPCFLKIAKGPIRNSTGFRTKLSKSSKANWAFANQYAGKLSLIAGFILLIISIILVVATVLTEKTVLLLTSFQLLGLIGVTIATQYKLKRFQGNDN